MGVDRIQPQSPLFACQWISGDILFIAHVLLAASMSQHGAGERFSQIYFTAFTRRINAIYQVIDTTCGREASPTSSSSSPTTTGALSNKRVTQHSLKLGV
jgi:hypothetical protein